MPIYEYTCNNCHNQFELLQKVSDEPATDCPNCSEPEVRKMVSATSFRLKGSGWYETDFKDTPKNTEKSKTTSVGTKSPETKTVESKAESKPQKSVPKAE